MVAETMKDLTIIFYTANVVDDGIMREVTKSLQSHKIPIISVSQRPMSLGYNVVIPKERSVRNLYKQVLIGASIAETEYVALCEDDCFYSKGHFEYRPAHFGYNTNRWLLHLREQVFSYRNRVVLSQCIAKRKSLVDTLNERLSLQKLEDRFCGEPGRFEKYLKLKVYPLETFSTNLSNLVICHENGIMGHKKLGGHTCKDNDQWGSVEEWISRIS